MRIFGLYQMGKYWTQAGKFQTYSPPKFSNNFEIFTQTHSLNLSLNTPAHSLSKYPLSLI